MKCVQRKSLREIEETCGGETRRQRYHSEKEGSIKELYRFPLEENKKNFRKSNEKNC